MKKSTPNTFIWHVLGVFASVGMLFGVWLLGIKPMSAAAINRSQTQQTMDERQRVAVSLANEVENLDTLVESQKDGLLKTMPIKGKLANLNRHLDQLIKVFQHHDASIMSLEPSEPFRTDEYIRVPIAVRGEISFHGFVSLLKTLHADALDTRIDAFDLKGSSTEDALSEFSLMLTWHALPE